MESLGEVVAERELQVIGATIRSVTVRLGRPRPDGNDWACPYQLDGVGDGRVNVAYGIDGLQALLMAVEGARHGLDASGSRFGWGGEEEGTGIPKSVPLNLPLEFREKAEAALAAEVERFGQTMLARRQSNNR